jgi:hypothetical protein
MIDVKGIYWGNQIPNPISGLTPNFGRDEMRLYEFPLVKVGWDGSLEQLLLFEGSHWPSFQRVELVMIVSKRYGIEPEVTAAFEKWIDLLIEEKGWPKPPDWMHRGNISKVVADVGYITRRHMTDPDFWKLFVEDFCPKIEELIAKKQLQSV